MPMLANKEFPFAKGEDFTETERMRVAFCKLDRLHPDARFPVVYQTQDGGGELSLSFTPAEGRWLADVLTRMFRD